MRYIIFCLFSVCVVGCNTKTTDKVVTINDSLSAMGKTDSALPAMDAHYYWEADMDQRSALILKRKTPIAADSLTAKDMLMRMNEIYPEIPLKVIAQKHDTLFIAVTNSKYLTEQMGSSGPEAYIGELVYNVTEVEGINFVNLSFKQRDHGAPGTYSRTDFVQKTP